MFRIRTDLGEFHGAHFVTSSYTNPENCVAVATPATGPIGVKDSKDPWGPVLAFPRDAWKAFVEYAKTAEV